MVADDARAPRWDPDRQVLLRHHLLLPAQHVDDALAVARQDGYVATGPTRPSTGDDGRVTGGDARLLVLQRVQVLDALHCSQERSRMVGLAQRRDGVVLGWDALQPAGWAPADPAHPQA